MEDHEKIEEMRKLLLKETFEELLKSQPDINAMNKEGRTPCMSVFLNVSALHVIG